MFLNLFKRKCFGVQVSFSHSKHAIHFLLLCFLYFSDIDHPLREFFFKDIASVRDTINEVYKKN